MIPPRSTGRLPRGALLSALRALLACIRSHCPTTHFPCPWARGPGKARPECSATDLTSPDVSFGAILALGRPAGSPFQGASRSSVPSGGQGIEQDRRESPPGEVPSVDLASEASGGTCWRMPGGLRASGSANPTSRPSQDPGGGPLNPDTSRQPIHLVDTSGRLALAVATERSAVGPRHRC